MKKILLLSLLVGSVAIVATAGCKVWQDTGTKKCFMCNGKGTVKNIIGSDIRKTCMNCRGSGSESTKKCVEYYKSSPGKARSM